MSGLWAKLAAIHIYGPPLILALSFHEFCHGLAAYWLGDDTAKRLGRLKINPLAHLDLLGTIMLLVANFGWAKPVPINPYNFKHFKRDTALTAAAGPASNLLLATVFALLFKLFIWFMYLGLAGNWIWQYFALVSYLGVMYNLLLAFFNLIPIPPLDGSKILGGFLSDRAYFRFMQYEQKGFMILMVIILISYVFKIDLIGGLIMPPVHFGLQFLTGTSLNDLVM